MVLIVLALACVDSPPAWRNSLDPIETALLTEGVCPSEPPEQASMVDGTLYSPEWAVDDERSMRVVGHHMLRVSDAGDIYTVLYLDAAHDETLSALDCDMFNTAESAEGSAIWLGEYELKGTRSAPAFLAAPPLEGWWQRFSGGVQQESTTKSGNAYGWLCLEHAEGTPGWPEDTSAGPNWSGAMAMHIDDDGTGGTSDAFISFDSVDCASEEDASDYLGDRSYETSVDCDGIDNDFDGVVDEGASDHDGDGVADCLPPTE